MEELSKKYNIEMEVLTPLSIGAGEESDWMPGADYVVKDGVAYVLDLHKAVVEDVDITKISELFLKGDESGIVLLLGSKLDNVAKYKFKMPAQTSNPIKTFLRSKLVDKPVVAGSSIKGAVRSVLFSYLRNDETRTDSVFGTMKEGTDLMRFIRISDFEMEKTNLVNTKIFNLRTSENGGWEGGWKKGQKTEESFSATGFNTVYESVMPGEKTVGSITLACRPFEQVLNKLGEEMPYAKPKQEIINGDIKILFGIINDATRTYLRKERKFFETYMTDRVDSVINSIDGLLKTIPSDNSYCVMKMSAGAGFHSITGDYIFDDYCGGLLGKKANRDAKPKSRKIAIYDDRLTLMGFVKLMAINDSQYKECLEKVDEMHREAFNERLKDIRQKEDEKEKILQAEKAKRERYLLLLDETNALIKDEKFDEAENKLSEAESICPTGNNISKIRAQIKEGRAALMQKQNLLAVQEYEQAVKEESRKKNSVPLAERIEKITSVGNLAGTLNQWLKTPGNQFGENEFNVLVAFIQNMEIKNKSKEMCKKRKDFEKAIGSEWVGRIFKSIDI